MGNGVDSNQGSVSEMIFEDLNDVVIQMHADYTKRTKIKWYEGESLYITKRPIEESQLYGDHLVYKGLPALSLTWTTSTIQFSPLGLFGKLSVPIEDMFLKIDPTSDSADDWLAKQNQVSPTKKGAIAGASAKLNPAEQKREIANYFLAELNLFAEMCLDRNYISMQNLDDLFSYEALVTILQLNVKDELKAMAAHLILYLHVDRDPQAITVIPTLTRTWSEVSKDKVASLPFVDVSRHYWFGLIQQIISKYLRDIVGKEWTEYTMSMATLLNSLVRFNFYGTSERLEDVIEPILNALDRRVVERFKKNRRI